MGATIDVTRAHESTAVNTFGSAELPPHFVRAAGATLWDESGRPYVDLVCGSAVTNLGHGHPAHQAAVDEALRSGILHTGTRLPSKYRADFYRALLDIVPPALTAIHLLNSGAEAVETALKAAQYKTGRNEIISFYGAYHGRTRGALAVTATKRVRDPFRPFDTAVHFFPYPNTYRPPLPGTDARTIGEACLEFLRGGLRNPVSGISASALIVEAVQGVSGVVIPPAGFLKGLREICSEFGLVMIVDEIWTGFGRTGRWFGFDHDGICPDLVAFGKAASGSLPLAGVVGRAELLRAWPAGIHTSTFQGNPLACAAATATVRVLKEEGVLDRCAGTIEPALKAFGEAIATVSGVGDVRVVGALAGIELVGEAKSPDAARVKAVQQFCLDRGVLCYGGGWHSNVVMLVPPLVITDAELARALDVVTAALRATA